MQVFISYKSEYLEFAQRVKDAIESWGFGTWLDQDDIPKGGYFRHAIQQGLESSDIVLGIVTPEALASREVQAEWDFAYSESQLFLLLYAPVTLPYHLRGVQYIDVTNNVNIGIQQLQDALSGKQTPTVAPPQTHSQPKAAQKSTEAKESYRLAMLDKVQQYWVEGVLHKALGETNALQIGMDLSAGAVLKHRDYTDYVFEKDDLTIVQVFDDLRSELLILGAPGSGKTFMLLQLGEALIAEARDDTTKPIPVIFNLSTWSVTRKSLRDWLIDELNLRYQIPKRLSKRWVDNEGLLLLLDGLDEVDTEHRQTCLEAINAFRNTYRGVDMAICSRITEYEALTSKLDVRGAITLQPLTEDQVQEYLAGESYIALREKINSDESLYEMAEVPFLLNTMAYAYEDMSPAGLAIADDENRAHHLFNEYVARRIKENHSKLQYTPKEIRSYLSWLANGMISHSTTAFYIESLQKSWFKKQIEEHIYLAIRIILILTGTTLFGLLTFYLYRTQDAATGFFVALIGSVIFVLPPRVNRIATLSWSWKRALLGLILGLLGIYLIMLIYSLVYFVVYNSWVFSGFVTYIQSLPIIGGFFGALLGGVTAQSISGSKSTVPNEGIKLSIYRSMLSLPIGVVLFGLFSWYDFWIYDRIIGAVGGFALAFLALGGSDVMKHTIIRLILYFRGYSPLNYGKFLEYCTNDLLILRKVGGSYIFRHRYLLEFFAGRELK